MVDGHPEHDAACEICELRERLEAAEEQLRRWPRIDVDDEMRAAFDGQQARITELAERVDALAEGRDDIELGTMQVREMLAGINAVTAPAVPGRS